MNFDIVKKIVCEKDNSQLVPSKPRNELQKMRLHGVYELLVVLRIILTLNIQTGWIHQDEFTNSLEVAAGDYFDLQVFKSPGFNASFPTRSLAILHTTVKLPYILCQSWLQYLDNLGKESIPNAKLLILIPRLVNVALSFIVDYILIKFCELNQEKNPKRSPRKSTKQGNHNGHDNPKDSSCPSPDLEEDRMKNDHTIRLVTLASSQVMLIFASRTHASSLNLILFAALLYFVSDSFHRFSKYAPILEKYHRARDPVEKVRYLKNMKATGYSPIKKLHIIALIIVIGIFNDPDFFLSYSCVPLFFYMQRGVSHRNVGMKYFHARCFTFLAYLFTFSIPFIIYDSMAYGRVTYNDFRELNLSAESFVVTPANFFATKAPVLQDITWYPRTLVSYLGLFNILGAMGIISFCKETYDIFFSEWRHKPNLDSQWIFLNCSIFIPLFFLLQSNNQTSSPFDLVPLIFPLIYMHGHKIPLISRFSSKLGLAWFICNLVGITYWGYISQGGILSSFLDLYNQLSPIRYNETYVDITFSQMAAIPPTFVLAIPSKWKTLLKAPYIVVENEETIPENLYKTVLRLESNNKIRVYHTGVSPLPVSHLERDLSRLLHNHDGDNEEIRAKNAHFLIIPYSYGRHSEETFSNIKLTRLKTYWNHLHLNLWKDSTKGHTLYDFGLCLYKMEQARAKSRSKNGTETNSLDNLFVLYSNGINDFLVVIWNFLTVFMTSVFFLMSYLVFLT